MPRFRDVDPRTLLLPPSRQAGADLWKLARQIARQIARFGASDAGMPPPEVLETPAGDLVCYGGVTRAARLAELAPGRTVRVEIAGAVTLPAGLRRTIGDTPPSNPFPGPAVNAPDDTDADAAVGPPAPAAARPAAGVRAAIFAELGRLWESKPDLRFGQMAANAALVAGCDTGAAPADLTDAAVLAAARRLRRDAERSRPDGPTVDPLREDYVVPGLRAELLRALGALWDLRPTLRFVEFVERAGTAAGAWLPEDQWDLEDERLLRVARELEGAFLVRRAKHDLAVRETARSVRGRAAAA